MPTSQPVNLPTGQRPRPKTRRTPQHESGPSIIGGHAVAARVLDGPVTSEAKTGQRSELHRIRTTNASTVSTHNSQAQFTGSQRESVHAFDSTGEGRRTGQASRMATDDTSRVDAITCEHDRHPSG